MTAKKPAHNKKNTTNNIKLVVDGAHQEVHTDMLDKGKPFVIAVFADWCSHCVRLTSPQPGKKMSEWDHFLKDSTKYLGKTPVVELTYDMMSNLTRNKSCELGRVLAASATSFPFLAIAKKDLVKNKINVHVYDESYPMTAMSIKTFLQRK